MNNLDKGRSEVLKDPCVLAAPLPICMQGAYFLRPMELKQGCMNKTTFIIHLEGN